MSGFHRLRFLNVNVIAMHMDDGRVMHATAALPSHHNLAACFRHDDPFTILVRPHQPAIHGFFKALPYAFKVNILPMAEPLCLRLRIVKRMRLGKTWSPVTSKERAFFHLIKVRLHCVLPRVQWDWTTTRDVHHVRHNARLQHKGWWILHADSPHVRCLFEEQRWFEEMMAYVRNDDVASTPP